MIRRMRRKCPSPRIITGCLLVGSVLLTGCFETKDEFTLNPDGSGKVVHECSFQKLPFDQDQRSPEEQLRPSVSKLIETSKGVDAWRDVTFKRLEDGRMYFRGTAYFKSLSRLQIAEQQLMMFDWSKTGEGKFTLSARSSTNSNRADSAQALSGEDRIKKLKEDRAKYRQAKPVLTAVFGGIKQETIFHLPGTISGSSNFQTVSPTVVRISFSGSNLLAQLDKKINDDHWLLRQSEGKHEVSDFPQFDGSSNEFLFGQKAPANATVIGAAKSQFDYAAELALAQIDFAKIQQKLNLDLPPDLPPAEGQPLESLAVTGVRLVREVGPRQPFMFSREAGYTLTLRGVFSGPVQVVTGGTIETAIADDGSNLLPPDYKRKSHSPTFSSNSSAFFLDVGLKIPGPSVNGLREISGKVQYMTMTGVRRIDLGFTELKEGAKGTELGALIKVIEASSKKDGSQQLHLSLNLRRENLTGISLVVGGNRTPLKQHGYSGGGATLTYYLEYPRAIPINGHLVADIYDEVKAFEVPFKLENLSLLGAPLNPPK